VKPRGSRVRWFLTGFILSASTPKAIWKLGWFLRDFLCDPESLTREEIDERDLRGLVGVVKVSY